MTRLQAFLCGARDTKRGHIQYFNSLTLARAYDRGRAYAIRHTTRA